MAEQNRRTPETIPDQLHLCSTRESTDSAVTRGSAKDVVLRVGIPILAHPIYGRQFLQTAMYKSDKYARRSPILPKGEIGIYSSPVSISSYDSMLEVWDKYGEPPRIFAREGGTLG